MTKKQYLDKAYETLHGLLETYRENFPEENVDIFNISLHDHFDSFPDMTAFYVRASNSDSDTVNCSMSLVESGGEREYRNNMGVI